MIGTIVATRKWTSPVVVSATATKLSITTQPSSTPTTAVAFAQQPVIQLRDAGNNAVSQSGVTITASRATGSDTLGGTLTATTDGSGVATFADLKFTGTAGVNTIQFASSGLTSVTSGNVTPQAGSSFFQNEPVSAGWTRFIDESFTVDTPTPWVANYMGFGGVSPTSVSDATAPCSGPKVLKGITPAGQGVGTGPFTYGFDLPTPYKNVYYAGVQKWDANWQNTVGGAGTKHMWLAGDQLQGTGTYITLDGEFNMNFGIVQQGGRRDPVLFVSDPTNDHNRELYANLPGADGTLYSLRGQYVRWEVIHKANSAVDVFDGELHIWLNDVKTHEYPRSAPNGGSSGQNAGVNWAMDLASTGVRKWLSIVWNPTYGGGGSSPSVDQLCYLDHFRMAGSNL